MGAADERRDRPRSGRVNKAAARQGGSVPTASPRTQSQTMGTARETARPWRAVVMRTFAHSTSASRVLQPPSQTHPQSPNPCATTLRITLGSASPSSVAIGTQRMPSGARVRAGTRAA